LGGSGSSTPNKTGFEAEPDIHLKATGIDDMLDALELVNAKGDKGSIGAQVRFLLSFRSYPADLATSPTFTGWPDRTAPRKTIQSGLRSILGPRNAHPEIRTSWFEETTDA
jgi:hypothetical protein